MKYLFYTILLLGLASCNQGTINDLEEQIEVLQKENENLKAQNEYLIQIISNYENNLVRQRNSAFQRQQQRDFHQRNAEQNMREAEFWRQNGNDFLYESKMRDAQNELNMLK